MKQPLRRRRERRVQAASDLTITSMVDMFTMILTFLLQFVDPAMGGEGLLELPTARATSPASEGVTVSVDADGIHVAGQNVARLAAGGRALDPDTPRDGLAIVAVTDALKSVGAADERPLVLECDRRVPFSVVSAVLQSARAAGFSHYRFVVDREAQ